MGAVQAVDEVSCVALAVHDGKRWKCLNSYYNHEHYILNLKSGVVKEALLGCGGPSCWNFLFPLVSKKLEPTIRSLSTSSISALQNTYCEERKEFSSKEII